MAGAKPDVLGKVEESGGRTQARHGARKSQIGSHGRGANPEPKDLSFLGLTVEDRNGEVVELAIGPLNDHPGAFDTIYDSCESQCQEEMNQHLGCPCKSSRNDTASAT